MKYCTQQDVHVIIFIIVVGNVNTAHEAEQQTKVCCIARFYYFLILLYVYTVYNIS